MMNPGHILVMFIMRPFIFSFLIVFVTVICVEEVPRASPIRNTQLNEVRRAPVYKLQNTAPRAHGFKRVSTGVVRSTNISIQPTKRKSKYTRKPLSVPTVPLPSTLPMPPIVTFPPIATFPSLPTLATIPMPTLPPLTMPPSFQRLLGITTPATIKSDNEEKVRSEHLKKRKPTQKLIERKKSNSSKRLSPISSRLPKFVNTRNVVVVTPQENADWIVPF